MVGKVGLSLLFLRNRYETLRLNPLLHSWLGHYCQSAGHQQAGKDRLDR